MFCSKCGKEIHDEAVICVHCGCKVDNTSNIISAVKKEDEDKKSWIVTYLLVWFLGIFGIHRFYTGYIGVGIAQMLTLGGCGIWALVDFISLSFNHFKDETGKDLIKYEKALGIAGFCLATFGGLLYLLMVIVLALTESN